MCAFAVMQATCWRARITAQWPTGLTFSFNWLNCLIELSSTLFGFPEIGRLQSIQYLFPKHQSARAALQISISTESNRLLFRLRITRQRRVHFVRLSSLNPLYLPILVSTWNQTRHFKFSIFVYRIWLKIEFPFSKLAVLLSSLVS